MFVPLGRIKLTYYICGQIYASNHIEFYGGLTDRLLWNRRARGMTYGKRLLDALFLTNWNLANYQYKSHELSNGRCSWV